MQAQNISTIVVGPEINTVICLDIGLSRPAKKLQMARNDLNHLILRPGHDELRIVMAMLRTIGAYIDTSGIDVCWIESELYGPYIVKQILDGNHVKRGEKVHMVTLQAWFALYLDGIRSLNSLRVHEWKLGYQQEQQIFFLCSWSRQRLGAPKSFNEGVWRTGWYYTE